VPLGTLPRSSCRPLGCILAWGVFHRNARLQYNGFGGKIDPHETIRHAALRETVEEAGVTPLDAQLRGHITFEFVDHPEVLEVHVFHATKYAGEPTEGDEMRPEWCVDQDACSGSPG